jgi:hypothetical protein
LITRKEQNFSVRGTSQKNLGTKVTKIGNKISGTKISKIREQKLKNMGTKIQGKNS